jgi:molecular chaperone Hsp33
MAVKTPTNTPTKGNQDEDDWRRCMVLMDSAKEDELLDPDLHSNILLFRLFNEDGVRVYESTSVHHECRCDEQRVQNVLKTMDEEDLDYMAKDGTIDMCCEFCSKTYIRSICLERPCCFF